jgi:hypothetical protein
MSIIFRKFYSLQGIRNRTFQLFKQIVQPFWGLLIDIEEFETKLCTYLEDRTTTAKPPETGKGVSSAWLGLVFAVLAVATNYCELPYHKRVETSQTFGELPHPVSRLQRVPTNVFSPNIFPLSEAIKFLSSALARLTPGSHYTRSSIGE